MKTCTGDCLQCPAQQRVYCAAQMSRNSIDKLNEMESRMSELEEVLMAIDEKIERMGKSAEGEVFNPMKKEETQEAAV